MVIAKEEVAEVDGLAEDVLRWCAMGLGTSSGEYTASIVCELDLGCKGREQAPPCFGCTSRVAVSRPPDCCETADARAISAWTGLGALTRGTESIAIPTQ